ncbi:hypothetical protein BS47DRAFT_1326539 [Hydnum rufescens UP504]|uniref:DUF1479-domain-containing protein n=1 Tax=Hydnum rufescens UP504 TaxID=1448309 RepID=A0A9P6B427_9AGAM|nr:hypothetical protein BS47DRAFT_1326539 [Hydnum rufescens UP504]
MFRSTEAHAAAPHIAPTPVNGVFGTSPLAPKFSRSNRYAYNQSKGGGDISDAFSSLAGAEFGQLPARYADIKRAIIPTKEEEKTLVKTWTQILAGLEILVAEIKARGSEIIPKVEYKEIQDGTVSADLLDRIRTVGTVIVKGAVPSEVALGWKSQIQEYARTNRDLATGFPRENPQVWEFYHSKAQIQARTHPGVLGTQEYLLSQWHASPDVEVSFQTPISYFDRLRIRFPGDNKFSIGPHVDGGSVERWEDPTYRKCYSKLFSSAWEEYDPFDGTHRVHSTMDLYKGQGSCNVFRSWQGWLSMSTTSANEGTLQVVPNVKMVSAYIMLRPFFRPRQSRGELEGDEDKFLAAENWVLDLESTDFPGSVPSRGQELSLETHPHICFMDTVTSIPRVEPGDQVYWHCDVIHAVERVNHGTGDASVMYIPAVPLTENNAEYLAAQLGSFLAGYPPYDFSGGAGEGAFKDRSTADDVYPSAVSRRAVGLEMFPDTSEGLSSAQRDLMRKANEWLLGQA